MIELSRARIVVLECPIKNWGSPQVRDLFCKMVALKKQGFAREYPDSILPLDANDFYSTHMMVCEETTQGLEPFVAYKIVSNTLCNYYRQVFPPLSGLRLSKATQYENALMQAIASAEKNGGQISYDCSWTMKPEVREQRDLAKKIRDLITLMVVRYHQQSGIQDLIACGVHRFKTHEYFEWMGFKAISGPYPLFTSNDETVTLFHMHEFSKEALAVADQYEFLWRKRIEVSPQVEKASEIAKKAA